MGLMNLERIHPKLLFVIGGTHREIYHSPCGERSPLYAITTCLTNRL